MARIFCSRDRPASQHRWLRRLAVYWRLRLNVVQDAAKRDKTLRATGVFAERAFDTPGRLERATPRDVRLGGGDRPGAESPRSAHRPASRRVVTRARLCAARDECEISDNTQRTRYDLAQPSFIGDDDVIQAFATNGADQPLRVRVRRCAVKGKSTQPVQVRPKGVSVRLGSYSGGGKGDQTIEA